MSAAIIEKQDDTLTITPAGRLDTATTPLLDRELQPHLDGISHIVMDFTNVPYVSSSGLRLLLWLEQTLEERDGEVKVIHVSEVVLNIFEMVGFTNVVQVVTD